MGQGEFREVSERKMIDRMVENGLILQRPMEILTEKELAERLKLSRFTILKMRKKGLPFMRVSDSVRFDWAKVMEWINDATQGMGEELAQDRGLEMVHQPLNGPPVPTPDTESKS